MTQCRWSGLLLGPDLRTASVDGLARALAALGREPGFLDASKAQGRIDKILNDNSHRYWKGGAQSVFEMRLLYQLVAQR